MKLLDFSNLQRIHSFLEQVNVGEFVVKGAAQVFSCKLAGLDKKLSKSLDDAFQLDLAASPRVGSLYGASPVGPMTEPSSRRTLAHLILALNHVYPDYDFSLLRAHHFRKEVNLSAAEELIEERLLEASKVWDDTPGFGEQPLRCGGWLRLPAVAARKQQRQAVASPLRSQALWSAVDEAVDLKDCDVYSYKTDLESDPFGEDGSVWSFNYFFYNRKLKRLLYLCCQGIPRHAAESDSTSEFGEPDYVAGTIDI